MITSSTSLFTSPTLPPMPLLIGLKEDLKISDVILSFIDCKIKEKLFPSVISFLLINEFNLSLSFKTIYNYIDNGILESKNIDLLRKVRFSHKKHKKVLKRIYGTSIELRTNFINDRLEFGHWEGDCIVDKQHKSALLTLVERKTRMRLIFKLNEWNNKAVKNVLTKQLNFNSFKSITFDNGSEFSKCMELEKLETKIYYAHPYSSFERGSNENFNSIVRRFLPKGRDFRDVTEKRIKEIEEWINNYPRKILNFKTSKEKYIEKQKNSPKLSLVTS